MRGPRVLGAAMAVLLLASCASPEKQEPAAGSQSEHPQPRITAAVGVTRIPVKDRRPVAPLAGPRLGGGRLSLADYQGQLVVLNVWASWCAPCREEAPDLRRVWKQTKEDGVQFLGLNTRDSTGAAQQFVQEFGIGYPSFYDPNGSLVLKLRGLVPPQAVPATLIIDRKGRVAVRIVGPTTDDQLRPLINEVRRGPDGD